MANAETTIDLFAITNHCESINGKRTATDTEAKAYARFLAQRAGVAEHETAKFELNAHYDRREYIYTGATFECGTFVAFPGADQMIKGETVEFELFDENGAIQSCGKIFYKAGKIHAAQIDLDAIKASNKAFISAEKAAAKKPRAKVAKPVNNDVIELNSRIAELEAALEAAKAQIDRNVFEFIQAEPIEAVYCNDLPEIVYLMANPYIECIGEPVEIAMAA